MNFYRLKSTLEVICVNYFCLLPFVSFSSHIVTAIQGKAQPCQFFTGSNSTVVEHIEVGWFYSNIILNGKYKCFL